MLLKLAQKRIDLMRSEMDVLRMDRKTCNLPPSTVSRRRCEMAARKVMLGMCVLTHQFQLYECTDLDL